MVHDEIVVESSTKDAKKAAKLLRECMEKAGEVFCKHVTMPVDCVISDY